jgi:hypothetical protein
MRKMSSCESDLGIPFANDNVGTIRTRYHSKTQGIHEEFWFRSESIELFIEDPDPGFLAFVWLGSSPTPFPLPLSKLYNSKTQGIDEEFWFTSESIELFIEDQAFLRSYDAAPPHPLSPLSREQDVSLSLSSHVSSVELTGRGEREGVEEDLNHIPARKPGPL